MKKTIAILIMAFTLATSASAVQLNISGDLTPAQKAQIILQAEQLAAKTPEVPVGAAEIREWVEVGNAIGEGMAAAAGKLGVEVNKFADTIVGIFTMVIIAYHYIGQHLITTLFGVSIFMFGVPLWLWFYTTKASKRLEKEEVFEKGKGPGGLTISRTYTNTSEDIKGWTLGVLVVLLVVGTLTIIA